MIRFSIATRQTKSTSSICSDSTLSPDYEGKKITDLGYFVVNSAVIAGDPILMQIIQTQYLQCARTMVVSGYFMLSHVISSYTVFVHCVSSHFMLFQISSCHCHTYNYYATIMLVPCYYHLTTMILSGYYHATIKLCGRPQWHQHHSIPPHRSPRHSSPPPLLLAPCLWSPCNRVPPPSASRPLGRHPGPLPRRSRPKWWHRHTPQPACCHLLSGLPTLAKERRLRGKDRGTDRGTDGEMEGEIAVGRDGDRRTRPSHPIIITLSNNKKKNLNSNVNNNNDTIITIVLM